MASGEPETQHVDVSSVGAVVRQWKLDNPLVLYAASGCICKIGKTSDLNRQEVCQNVVVLEPVITHLGPLA